jgi:hypothetical protein
VVKAYLVAKNFMHLDIEKAIVKWLLALALVIMVLALHAGRSGRGKEQGTALGEEPGLSLRERGGKGQAARTRTARAEEGDGARFRTPLSCISSAPPARRRFANNALLGTALFVFTEVMFFAGFVSAFAVVESGSPPAPGLLPGSRDSRSRRPRSTRSLCWPAAPRCTWPAGAFASRVPARPSDGWVRTRAWRVFVVAQGVEWVRLLKQG